MKKNYYYYGGALLSRRKETSVASCILGFRNFWKFVTLNLRKEVKKTCV